MWRERLKGFLIITAMALVALGIVRYLAGHQEELVKSASNLTPEKIEKDILGVIIGGEAEDNHGFSGEKPESIKLIEQKTGELVKEIKQLPQEQLEVVRERVLRQVCEEVLDEDGNEDGKQKTEE